MGAHFLTAENLSFKPGMAELVERASKVMPVTAEMVLLIAKRVEALGKGAMPLVPVAPDQGPAQTAFLELIANKIGPGAQESESTRALRKILDEVIAERFPSLAGKG